MPSREGLERLGELFEDLGLSMQLIGWAQLRCGFADGFGYGHEPAEFDASLAP